MDRGRGKLRKVEDSSGAPPQGRKSSSPGSSSSVELPHRRPHASRTSQRGPARATSASNTRSTSAQPGQAPNATGAPQLRTGSPHQRNTSPRQNTGSPHQRNPSLPADAGRRDASPAGRASPFHRHAGARVASPAPRTPPAAGASGLALNVPATTPPRGRTRSPRGQAVVGQRNQNPQPPLILPADLIQAVRATSNRGTNARVAFLMPEDEVTQIKITIRQADFSCMLQFDEQVFIGKDGGIFMHLTPGETDWQEFYAQVTLYSDGTYNGSAGSSTFKRLLFRNLEE